MLHVVGSLRPSLRRSRAGVIAISSGILSAKAEHIKPSQTQEGEVFRMQTIVLGEMISEGVGHFSPKPNNSRTAKAEIIEAKFPTADASSKLEKRELSARTDVRTGRHSRFVNVLR